MNLSRISELATQLAQLRANNEGDSDEGITVSLALEDMAPPEVIAALARLALAAIRWRKCDVCITGQCAGHDDLADAADALVDQSLLCEHCCGRGNVHDGCCPLSMDDQ